MVSHDCYDISATLVTTNYNITFFHVYTDRRTHTVISMNHQCKKKKRPECCVKLLTSQDAFRPISGGDQEMEAAISCTRRLALPKRSVEPCSGFSQTQANMSYLACTRGLVHVMYTRVACATVHLAFHLLHPFQPSTYMHLFPYIYTPPLPPLCTSNS